jgi:hypothetical protein
MVSGKGWIGDERIATTEGVQIRAAEADAFDLKQNLARFGGGFGMLDVACFSRLGDNKCSNGRSRDGVNCRSGKQGC